MESTTFSYRRLAAIGATFALMHGAHAGQACPDATRQARIAIVAESAAPVRLDAWIEPNDNGDIGSPLHGTVREGIKATGNWVVGGLHLGARTGVEPVGAVVLGAAVITSPFAFLAGALNGASDATAYSERHRAVAAAIDAGRAERDLAGELTRLVGERIEAGSPVRTVLLHPGDRHAASGYRSLAACGIRAVMEIGIVRAGVPAPSMVEYAVRPMVIARVRAIRTADGAEFLAEEFQFRGRFRDFEAAASDGGRWVREEMAQGLYEIADRIAVARSAPADTAARGSSRALARFEGSGHGQR